MTTFHVGTGFMALGFEEAYQKAKPGDTISFDKHYHYTLPAGKLFTIDKDITLQGQLDFNNQGQTVYTNTILAKFVIAAGATVVMKQLWLEPGDNRSCLYITEKSQLVLDDVVINNNESTYNKLLIHADEQAQVTMSDITIKSHASNCSVRFDNANASITNSFIGTKLIVAQQTQLTLSHSSINNPYGNAIQSENARLTIDSTAITGADASNEWPAIWLEQSIATIKNSTVIQKDYIASIRLTQQAHLFAENNTLTSLKVVDHSIAQLNDTNINTQLYIEEHSVVKVTNGLVIKGETDGKVDCYVGNNAVLIADNITLQRINEPNIRIADHSFVHINQLEYSYGSTISLNHEIDHTSHFYQPQPPQGNSLATTTTINSSTQQTEQSALDTLNHLTGLHRVKQEINKMLSLVEFNKQREAQGLKVEKQALHSVFMGNPGTGKTTVARLMGQILFDNGVLTGKTFSFHEVSQEDLVSQNVGGTAPQTRKWLDQARGGVLFIDEAYNLFKKEGINHGQEAIDTIMKYMEDHRNEIMIIFAGYTKEMEQFLKSNPGLESRVPNHFHFDDYSPDEIVSMGQTLLTQEQYQLEDRDYYANQVKRAYNQSLEHSNGRWIRNFNQKLTLTLANRVIQTGDSNITTILNRDIEEVIKVESFQESQSAEDALAQLNQLIGISTVKHQVREFIALAEMNQKRAEAGFKTDDFSLHSLFLGNPGTGKTTVARIIGNLLYQKGIIKRNKFVEVSRSELVAGYIGQTALKTREVLESALGGVLFIDEAYTLNSQSSNDFGKEALDEILKFMEDHRKDMVIIFAGYSKEMGDFLQMNSGLTSRIPNTFDFEDYSPDEIAQIGLLHLHHSDYTVDETLYRQIVTAAYLQSNDHSNGRWIRNFNEKLIRQLSLRLGTSDVPLDQYNLITQVDLAKMS